MVWQNEGQPRQWSKSVGGGLVEHISNEEMAAKIKHGAIVFEGEEPASGWLERDTQTVGGKRYYTQVEWPITGEQVSPRFQNVIMPELAKLGEPENVRIVFGFDS